MSYAAATPAGGPIDILLAVRTAYSTVFENIRLALDLAWLPFALLVGTEIVALLLGGAGMFGMMLAALVRGLGFIVFGTIFIVRWHRFVLIGETASDGLFPPGWGLFFIVAIKITLGVIVGMVLLMLIGMVPPHILTGLIAAIGSIALARLIAAVLVFRRRDRAADRAARRLGPRRRQFLAALPCRAVYLPFAVLHYRCGRGASGAIVWLVFQIIGLAVSFAGVAVVASLSISTASSWANPAGKSRRRYFLRRPEPALRGRWSAEPAQCNESHQCDRRQVTEAKGPAEDGVAAGEIENEADSKGTNEAASIACHPA
jgi:hypothetical protein